MPVVVTCPACQQKARVPEAMLGQSVKCPACSATFTVPAGEGPAPLPAVETPPDAPVRAPLPADADSLRAVRGGTGVQLIAHCLYATALALYLLLIFIGLTGSLSGGGMGGRGGVLQVVITVAPTLLLLISGLLNLIGAGICVLAPPAYMARGLAIALLFLAMFAFQQFGSSVGLAFGFMDEPFMRMGGIGGVFWVAHAVFIWLIEVARLSVLAVFWRSMSCILRDARGAVLGRRLAIGGPLVQGCLVLVWIVISSLGATGSEVALMAVFGMLAVQMFVVIGGIGVIARLRRRLKAALLQ